MNTESVLRELLFSNSVSPDSFDQPIAVQLKLMLCFTFRVKLENKALWVLEVHPDKKDQVGKLGMLVQEVPQEQKYFFFLFIF